jgi:hypothetical protein
MLTIEFLFKDGGLTFAEADVMSGVHRSENTINSWEHIFYLINSYLISNGIYVHAFKKFQN